MTTTMPQTPTAETSAPHKAEYKDGISEQIIVSPDVDEVCCDGGSGALGHPQVWYSFDQLDHVVCGYCDRVFVKR